jgi:flagellar basal body rod protein FlgG
LKSILSSLFLVAPLLAAILIVASSARLATVSTGSRYDLTVVGRGYFRTVDESFDNAQYHRSIQLAINANGQLCAKVNGVLRQLDPPITVQSDQTKIDVSTHGQVNTEQGYSGGWVASGQLCLSMFVSENLSSDDRILVLSDQIGTPQESIPGNNGAGHILLGYRQEFVIPLSNTNVIAIGLAFITIAGCLHQAVRVAPDSPHVNQIQTEILAVERL